MTGGAVPSDYDVLTSTVGGSDHCLVVIGHHRECWAKEEEDENWLIII